VRQLAHTRQIRSFFHNENRGKGAAIRTAILHAVGDIVVIQDADLEYDPAEIEQLVEPIVQGRVDVVYGSRFRTGDGVSCSIQRRVANRFLTWLSNRFTGLHLTDMETCYKAFRREIATQLILRENRFGIEPELTAKIARGGWRLIEVPISYVPRGYDAGKKIGFRDGLRAIWCIFRYARWD
jgi:glycosyltransferase involved in cell wall biosynthesis